MLAAGSGAKRSNALANVVAAVVDSLLSTRIAWESKAGEDITAKGRIRLFVAKMVCDAALTVLPAPSKFEATIARERADSLASNKARQRLDAVIDACSSSNLLLAPAQSSLLPPPSLSSSTSS
jgi:hypothetical protein